MSKSSKQMTFLSIDRELQVALPLPLLELAPPGEGDDRGEQHGIATESPPVMLLLLVALPKQVPEGGRLDRDKPASKLRGLVGVAACELEEGIAEEKEEFRDTMPRGAVLGRVEGELMPA